MDWYADLVGKALASHPNDFVAAAAAVQPDLRLQIIKPIHAGWVMDCHAAMAGKTKLLFGG